MPDEVQLGLFGRTSQEPCQALTGVTLEQFSGSWPTSGRWSSNGLCWMLDGSESPNAADACSSSLASILQSPESVPSSYYLSHRAVLGILKRSPIFSDSTQSTASMTDPSPMESRLLQSGQDSASLRLARLLAEHLRLDD